MKTIKSFHDGIKKSSADGMNQHFHDALCFIDAKMADVRPWWRLWILNVPLAF